MWKSLKALFSNDLGNLDNMIVDFQKMLALSKEMTIMVTDCVFQDKDLEDIRNEFYKKDRHINKLEQQIRKEVVTYLSVQVGQNLSSCLVLLSVVHDAERLGDLAKNIFDIFSRVKRPESKELEELSLEIRNKIINWISLISEAFAEGNHEKVEKFVRDSFIVEKQCEDISNKLITDNSGVNYGAYVLLFRFYKRMLCHMNNIASSIIMPLDKLGYHTTPEKAASDASKYDQQGEYLP